MALLSPLPHGCGFWHPASLIATWFGVGRLPGAPGTWGSLAALPVAWVIHDWAGPWALLAAFAAVFAAGTWAAGVYGKAAGETDCPAIVVDEVAGQWFPLIFVPTELASYAAAFVLFRAFDIFKMWPASKAERELEGALGVMVDDLIAGLYTLVFVIAFPYWLFQ